MVTGMLVLMKLFVLNETNETFNETFVLKLIQNKKKPRL